MFKIGWQVYRERLPEVIGERIRRRMVVVGGIVAATVFVVLLLVGVLLDRLDDPVPGPAGVVVAVVVAAGFGCFGASMTPVGPKGWALPPIPGIGWRTQEAIARYYGRNPPAVDPQHRDAVLHGLLESRDQILRFATRSFLQFASWVGLVLGTVVFVLTFPVDGDRMIVLLGVWFMWLVISSGTGVMGIRTLGRQEQLRVETEALPPVPPAPPARGRPGTPKGSKLSLPGD